MSEDEPDLPRVSIPDGVMETEFLGGWTVDELGLLLFMTVVGITPYFVIDLITIIPGLLIGGVAFGVAAVIIAVTPEEKSPTYWISVKVRNMVFPTTYVLRPHNRHRETVTYQDAISPEVSSWLNDEIPKRRFRARALRRVRAAPRSIVSRLSPGEKEDTDEDTQNGT